MEKMDIKETKEMLNGIEALVLVLMDKFKDGLDFTDFLAVWDKFKEDAEFKKAMEDAYMGFNKIPAEIKDIDLMEGFELGKEGIEMVAKIMAKLQEEKK